VHRSDYVSLKIAVISSALLGGLIAGPSHARPRKTRPGVPQLVDISGQSYFANAHPYLEEPLEELIERIPELKALQPAPDQQALSIILRKTGSRVQEFFQNIVDLTAHEEIAQERLNAKGLITASQRLQYNYLILIHHDAFPPIIEEYRTDLLRESAGARRPRQWVLRDFRICIEMDSFPADVATGFDVSVSRR